MNRRCLTMGLLLLVAVAPRAHARELTGAWTASTSETEQGRIYFSLQTGRHDQHGSTFDLADFAGLNAATIASKTRVPVQFEIRREAGTIAFDGTFRNGHGGGDFTFTPNEDYPRKLRSVGVTLEKEGKEDELQQLMNLALFDVSTDFIRSMQSIGYRERLEKYVAFRIFDVNPTYVRDMNGVGYRNLTADKLVETRIHGATPEYIREMRRNGEDLSLDQYIESRIFQVTPEFAREMERAGYPRLDRSTLVQFRIHGVTTEYIRDLRELGYDRVPAQKLVEMRIHGVTPEFIRRVRKAGYHRVPIDKLVQMRIFNVEPEMVRALDDKDGDAE